MCNEETETHLYRRLWLDEAHELGQVACILADALAWQPTDEQPLPNALELAERAARLISALQWQVAVYQPRLKGRRQPEYA